MDLNSLERFTKRSPRLVLEEHDSCEVPAGCGGVVLRWIDPSRQIPVLCYLSTQARSRLLLDGEPLESAAIDVRPGRHAIALQLEGPEPGFVLALRRNLRPAGGPARKDVLFLTLADGTWRGTLTPPEDPAWSRPGFDDSAWPALVEVSAPEPRYPSWLFRDLRQAGAQFLGLPDARDRIWVRREWDIAP